MRGAAFPVALAILFGVMNGVYFFKPVLIEASLARAAERRREEEAKLHDSTAKTGATESLRKENGK